MATRKPENTNPAYQEGKKAAEKQYKALKDKKRVERLINAANGYTTL